MPGAPNKKAGPFNGPAFFCLSFDAVYSRIYTLMSFLLLKNRSAAPAISREKTIIPHSERVGMPTSGRIVTPPGGSSGFIGGSFTHGQPSAVVTVTPMLISVKEYRGSPCDLGCIRSGGNQVIAQSHRLHKAPNRMRRQPFPP